MHPFLISQNLEAQADEYRRQILQPDFAGFEAFYGCSVPLPLLQFYDLQSSLLAGVLYATIVRQGKEVRIDFIQYPQPMRESNWTRRYGREFFEFAVNTDGYPFLIKPSSITSSIYVDGQDTKPVPEIFDTGIALEEIVGSLSTEPGPKKKWWQIRRPR